MKLASRSEQETADLGRRLAGSLEPGDVISLDGGLGAGKTALTRGIAKGLNCAGTVVSPTFILLIEHPACAGGLSLYHFDAYRLGGADEFLVAGLDEYFDHGGVCVVEWGARIAGILPDRTLYVDLMQASPDRPDERTIALSWPGRPARLAVLADRLRGFETAEEQVSGGKSC